MRIKKNISTAEIAHEYSMIEWKESLNSISKIV